MPRTQSDNSQFVAYLVLTISNHPSRVGWLTWKQIQDIMSFVSFLLGRFQCMSLKQMGFRKQSPYYYHPPKKITIP